MKNFEQRLSRLEELVDKISRGEVPLEEAMSYFEEGIRLARGLEKDLSRVERKIEILVNQPDQPEDKPNLELFPELDNENGESATESHPEK
jgi:exodeoxyribonuclease VII small subunit